MSSDALVEHLSEVGKRRGRPPGQVAIAWTLRNPAVTGAIVGARNAKQVEGNVGAAELFSQRRSRGDLPFPGPRARPTDVDKCYRRAFRPGRTHTSSRWNERWPVCERAVATL